MAAIWVKPVWLPSGSMSIVTHVLVSINVWMLKNHLTGSEGIGILSTTDGSLEARGLGAIKLAQGGG